MSKMVYLAGPVDAAGDFRWQEGVIGRLIGAGYTVYNPSKAFHMAPRDMSEAHTVTAINNVALKHADILLAYLPHNVPTVGTCREIERAVNQRYTRVYVVVEQGIDRYVSLQDVDMLAGSFEELWDIWAL